LSYGHSDDFIPTTQAPVVKRLKPCGGETEGRLGEL
jgi:hypothetical protein